MGAQEPPYFGYYSRIGLHASGKRVAENGDKMALKQAVKIECAKQPALSCLEATASIVGNEPEIEVAHYDFIQWDDSGLIAQDDSPECATHKLVVNFKNKASSQLTLRNKALSHVFHFQRKHLNLSKGDP